MHNPPAFTSPVDEVVAWGEDTWPLGGGCGRPPPAFCFTGTEFEFALLAAILLDAGSQLSNIRLNKV